MSTTKPRNLLRKHVFSLFKGRAIYSARCNGMVHACVCMMCVTKSAQGAKELIFGMESQPSTGEVQIYSNGVLDLEMRSKCRGHYISIGHILSNCQRLVKMLGVLRYDPKWFSGV